MSLLQIKSIIEESYAFYINFEPYKMESKDIQSDINSLVLISDFLDTDCFNELLRLMIEAKKSRQEYESEPSLIDDSENGFKLGQ